MAFDLTALALSMTRNFWPDFLKKPQRRVARQSAVNSELIQLLETRSLLSAISPTLFSEAATTALPVGPNPWAIATADFNSDGITDIAATNAGDGTVSVIQGLGSGMYGTEVRYSLPSYSYGLVAADFDGDAVIDLMTCNTGAHNISFLKGNGNGTFQPQVVVGNTAGQEGNRLIAADFNGDHVLDLAVPTWNGYVAVLLGIGNGTFGPTSLSYSGGLVNCSGIVAGDFNGDSFLDLATANVYGQGISIFQGTGDGTFAVIGSYSLGGYTGSLVLGDFDSDGHLDLAAPQYNLGRVSVLRGAGNGTFSGLSVYPVGSTPLYLQSADVNGDGFLDLMTADYGSNSISVIGGNGDGTFQSTVAFAAGANPLGIAATDIDNNGTVDILVSNSNAQLSLLKNVQTPETVVVEPADRGRLISGGSSSEDTVQIVVSLTEALTPAVEAAFDAYQAHLDAGLQNTPFTLTPLNITLAGFEHFDRLLSYGSFRGIYDNPIAGSNYSESLTGTVGRDLVAGNGGNDSIFGLGGADIIIGASGDDSIDGGEGDDSYLYSGAANGFDTVISGTGYDKAIAVSAGTVIGLNGYVNGVDEFVGLSDTIIRDTAYSKTLDFSNTVLTGIAEIDAAGGNDVVTASNLSPGVYRGGAGDDVLTAGSTAVTWKYSGTSNGFDTLSNGSGVTLAVVESAGTVIGVNGYINGVDEFVGLGDTIIRDTAYSKTLDFSNTVLTGIAEIDAAGGNDVVTASNLSPGVYRGGAGDDVLNAGSTAVTWKYSGASNGFDTLNNGSAVTLAVVESAGTVIGVNGYVNGVDEFVGLGDTIIRDTAYSKTLDFSNTVLTGIAEIDAAGGNDVVTASNLSPGVYRGGAGDDVLNAGSAAVTWKYSGAGNGYDTLNNGSGAPLAVVESAGTVIGVNGYINGVDEFVGLGDTIIRDTAYSKTLDFSNTVLTGIAEIDAAGGNDVVTASNLSPGVYRGGAGDDVLNAGSTAVTWKYSGASNGFDTLNNGSGVTLAVVESAGTVIGVNGFVNGVDEFVGLGDTIIRDTAYSKTLDFSNTVLTGIAEIDAAGGNDVVTASNLSSGVYRGGSGDDVLNAGSTAVSWEYSGTSNGFDTLNNGSGVTRAVAESAGTVIGVNGYVNGVDEFAGLGDIIIRDTAYSKTLDFSNTVLTSIAEIDAAGGNDVVTASQLSSTLYRLGTGDDTLVILNTTVAQVKVSDFKQSGRDRIDLRSFGISNGLAGLTRSQSGADILVSGPPNLDLRLLDTLFGSLVDTDFLF